MEKENKDYVVCKVCNKSFKQITSTHLKTKHDLTIDQYNKLYDYPLLVCEEISLKKGKAIKKRKKGKKYIAWNKNKPQSNKQKQKQSKTMKEKYENGDLVHWNKGNSLSEGVKQKISNSLKGHKNFNEQSKEKRKETIKQKKDNGWISPLKGRVLSEEHKNKSRKTLKENALKKQKKFHQDIIDKCKKNKLQIMNHDYYYYNLKCLVCGEEFKRTRQIFNESKNDGKKICPSCYPPSFISKGETDFSNYVSEIYNGTIILNDRKALNGKEIDCYLPDLNIGFEYCGLYWHSELYHEKNHLINKQKYGLSKGIKIYTIFENEWLQLNDIVKSRIKSILGKSENKIYARNTNIKRISAKKSNEFLKHNHLQGADKTKIRYGAFYENNLVAVMTFSKGGFIKIKDGGYELNRFCVKQNHSAVGIASKLFKQFLNDYDPDKVVSYANCRWSYGNLYKKMGFIFKHMSPPSPWYTNDFKYIKHRSNFMKHKIKNIDKFNSTKEAIKDLGYFKVYDCGNTVWEYIK